MARRVKNAKRNMEKKLAHAKGGNNTRNFANYIKSKTKARTGIGPLKTSDGKLITEDQEMATELNNFFTSVFSREDLLNMPAVTRETQALIPDMQITTSQIINKIRALKEKSAPGPDGISPRLLKIAQKELAGPLKILFQHSINTGIVPKDWRHAKVVPIFKKGGKGQAENYRPVSLNSVPCKILESLIADCIKKHLTTNRLHRDTQHGFVSGRSCATNLITFQDKLRKSLTRVIQPMSFT